MNSKALMLITVLLSCTTLLPTEETAWQKHFREKLEGLNNELKRHESQNSPTKAERLNQEPKHSSDQADDSSTQKIKKLELKVLKLNINRLSWVISTISLFGICLYQVYELKTYKC